MQTKHSQVESGRTEYPFVLAALDHVLTMANSLVRDREELKAMALCRREEFEDGMARILQSWADIAPVIDLDGSIANWLTDVVREFRRGNPGASWYELDQVIKKLRTIESQWRDVPNRTLANSIS